MNWLTYTGPDLERLRGRLRCLARPRFSMLLTCETHVSSTSRPKSVEHDGLAKRFLGVCAEVLGDHASPVVIKNELLETSPDFRT
jgi:hypothetical protein